MFALVLDVSFDIGDCRPRNRKRAISVLPGESVKAAEFVLDPSRGSAFQILRGIAGADGWVNADERVDVIVDAANLFRVHFVIAGDPAEVFPNTGFDVGADPIDAVLGAEDYV